MQLHAQCVYTLDYSVESIPAMHSKVSLGAIEKDMAFLHMPHVLFTKKVIVLKG